MEPSKKPRYKLSAEAKKHKREYDKRYKKEFVHRISMDFKIEKYEQIKDASKAAGESVNGYIRKAIDDRISGSK